MLTGNSACFTKKKIMSCLEIRVIKSHIQKVGLTVQKLFSYPTIKYSCNFSKHVASFIRETLKNLLFIVSNILGLGSTQSRIDGIENLLRPTWANLYPSSSSLFYKSSLLFLTKVGVFGKNSDVILSIVLLSELKVVASVGKNSQSDWVLGMSQVQLSIQSVYRVILAYASHCYQPASSLYQALVK